MKTGLIGPPGYGERRALPVGASVAGEVGVDGAEIGRGCVFGAGPGAGRSILPCISPPAPSPPSPGPRDAGLHPNGSAEVPGLQQELPPLDGALGRILPLPELTG